MSSQQDWDIFCARRERLKLPLRPDADVAALLGELVADCDARVLMLGVTPELCAIGRELTVADWNEQMLRLAWPPSRLDARPVQTDWREMRFAPPRFTAAVGDGSLSVLTWPDDYELVFERLAVCLAPGACLAVRCFVSPDLPEALHDIRDIVLQGDESSFHALKWRIAMALAAQSQGNIAVTDILAGFESCFPDRDLLAARTGWDLQTISEIDSYRESGAVYSFITREQLARTLPATFVDVRFAQSGNYPLAERCPFLVAEFLGDG